MPHYIWRIIALIAYYGIGGWLSWFVEEKWGLISKFTDRF